MSQVQSVMAFITLHDKLPASAVASMCTSLHKLRCMKDPTLPRDPPQALQYLRETNKNRPSEHKGKPAIRAYHLGSTKREVFDPRRLLRVLGKIKNEGKLIDLRRKLCVLLAMDGLARPADLAAIDRALVQVTADAVILPFVAPKNRKHEIIQTRIEAYPDKQVCTVHTLRVYMRRTRRMIASKDLQDVTTLNGHQTVHNYGGLLQSIPSKRTNKVHSASKQVISKAIGLTLREAGLDERMSGYYIKHAATSKLLNLGVDIERVRQRGRWTSTRSITKNYWVQIEGVKPINGLSIETGTIEQLLRAKVSGMEDLGTAKSASRQQAALNSSH